MVLWKPLSLVIVGFFIFQNEPVELVEREVLAMKKRGKNYLFKSHVLHWRGWRC